MVFVEDKGLERPDEKSDTVQVQVDPVLEDSVVVTPAVTESSPPPPQQQLHESEKDVGMGRRVETTNV